MIPLILLAYPTIATKCRPREQRPKEVFHIKGYNYEKAEALNECQKYNATVATEMQLIQSQRRGANWCSTGWLADSNDAAYPITESLGPGCGGGTPGIKKHTPAKAGINCYGVKPVEGTVSIASFNTKKWSEYLEVYHIAGYENPTREAAALKCARFGGVLASTAQVSEAFTRGADWCSWGYTSDNVAFPNQRPRDGCSLQSEVAILADKSWNGGKYGATCYGVKPKKETANILPFNDAKWSDLDIHFIVTDVKEVFHIRGYNYEKADALNECQKHNATVATEMQLIQSHKRGANWCSTGWLADTNEAAYPITEQLVIGCGGGTPGIKKHTPAKAGINCYGVKPAEGTAMIASFNTKKWSEYFEVYHISGYDNPSRDNAAVKCAKFGGILASTAQVSEAFTRGADWCSWGYTSDNVAFPNQRPREGCSLKSEVAILADKSWNNGRYGANCYGVKPVKGTANILAFNDGKWSDLDINFILTEVKEVYHISGYNYAITDALNECKRYNSVVTTNM